MDRKIAIVSGSATGIGRASAVRLAEDGFALVLADWNEAEGKTTLSLCREVHQDVDFVLTDMGKEDEVKKLVDFTMDKYGKIDFFFNNQGVLHMPRDFDELTEEDMDYVLHSNFKACFFGMKHVLKVMKEQGYGHILNTGSSSGIRPETGFGVYSATKHGVLGMSKVAAMEYARYDVRINCLCPGGFITPMTMEVGQFMQENQYQQPKPSVALLGPAKMGDTSEIVGMVSLLASENSSYMTGAVISVDGGNTL
ncbi:SDR family NAD(P)-dependent oxidoreductase [Enterococcus hulanensis]|uniref:SDR family NAD(P)-dependent oxidoreductase n=1 Tax=Enterococcus hulanensis TaxID=2559929 RepID=A0ABU3EZ43_9ENTE|nr:SDR family oxidoreductase [Enterococcus hulanensis]MDT2600142.1 SDR family NAD(P)-dependent oxidoreductase [Enterococcus hulanensis]MDT2608955.1 SDR family NAD(P)-dependent oxidoreductase [Enterococcus hulanensis]MDT2617003.1 SDR family NAD(P)-dependent oxidoreductase [Enterococcus hulanensis]MDT2628477.1 SDR family NAD(P)-dependent oxidoreductase [Enterococcus hulanensis]MDT2655817.1 SDR family NAD(P)-dependent oxidoreductase [Enterococcus hulanensis]